MKTLPPGTGNGVRTFEAAGPCASTPKDELSVLQP
jgi:hypothetical protein